MNENDTILDIGCGDKRYSNFLIANNRKVTTVDAWEKVNPDILGGFMIEVDNLRWDATLKNELRSIKNKLIESSI
jgi:2-polyprenyl-3-methyl-5-hydroxy-6-metoxy-1,4-benzoquinol methylase